MHCISGRLAKPSHLAHTSQQRLHQPTFTAFRPITTRATPEPAQTTTEAQPAAPAPAAAAAAAPPKSEEERFHEAYAKAYTMSQLYVEDRPPPVPQSEYEARRRKRDMEDILAVSGLGRC